MAVNETRSTRCLPMVRSLPNIMQTDNSKVANYFTDEGRNKWRQTSLTFLLKKPAKWNRSISKTHAENDQDKQKRMVFQPKLPQLVRQCNAQRAREEDDALLRKSVPDVPAFMEVKYVENCFKERLFPYGIELLPKQVSFNSLVPQSLQHPPYAHIDVRHTAYLTRCAGLYAVACQYVVPMIHLHRSTFCRFILDCQLTHPNKLPYVDALEMGFERWKTVASGGESGGIGLEMLELPQFCQCVMAILKVFYSTNELEYFFHQEKGPEPKEIGPLLRYAEEKIPYCKWVDDKYGTRCNKIPVQNPQNSIQDTLTWQRRMVRNMLVEPGAIHLVTSYRWVFTAIFEAYATDGHVDEPRFMRFCKDFDLIPNWGAQQLYISAYRNSECLGVPLVPPDHKVIQKLALRSLRDLFPTGTWENAWRKLFGRTTHVDYETWERATSNELSTWGEGARELAWDALTLAPVESESLSPWLRRPEDTFPKRRGIVALDTQTFVDTMTAFWPPPTAARSSSPAAPRQRALMRRQSMPDMAAAMPARDDRDAQPPDAVDFVLWLSSEEYNVRAAWNKMVRASPAATEEEEPPPSPIVKKNSSPTSRGMGRRASLQGPASKEDPEALLEIFRKGARRASRTSTKAATVGVCEADFVRFVVPKYTQSKIHASALFKALFKAGEKKSKAPGLGVISRRHSTSCVSPAKLTRGWSTIKSALEADDFVRPGMEMLELRHINIASLECTLKNNHASASAAPPTSPASGKGDQAKFVMGEQVKFGASSFTEAVLTAVLMHLSFFSTEVRQNTSTVNKICVFFSHLAHWVERHPPWDSWVPAYPDEDSPQPQSKQWSDTLVDDEDEIKICDDSEVLQWKAEEREKRSWAAHKRALWVLQRLVRMDLQDPPVIWSLLNPRPNTTGRENNKETCDACKRTRSPQGWGNPLCHVCCCASRAIVLQLYPCLALMCSPSMVELPNANMRGPAVAEEIPSPFTTLTAFRPASAGNMERSDSKDSGFSD